MKTNRLMNWFTGVVLLSCWLGTIDRARADDKVDPKDKIKGLQKQRLESATKARDYLVKQFRDGFVPAGAVDTLPFTLQLVEVNKLVADARLDLCETKPERIKALEDTIKEFEPILDQFAKRNRAGIANATLPFHLLQAQILELKIALEKTKQSGK
jgi:hypothetical protein